MFHLISESLQWPDDSYLAHQTVTSTKDQTTPTQYNQVVTSMHSWLCHGLMPPYKQIVPFSICRSSFESNMQKSIYQNDWDYALLLCKLIKWYELLPLYTQHWLEIQILLTGCTKILNTVTGYLYLCQYESRYIWYKHYDPSHMSSHGPMDECSSQHRSHLQLNIHNTLTCMLLVLETVLIGDKPLPILETQNFKKNIYWNILNS